MKSKYFLLLLTVIIYTSVFGQKGYQDYQIVFRSGLSSIPQVALDSHTFVLGTKEKKGVFNAYNGWMIPMIYDSVYQPIYYGQKNFSNGYKYSFYRVKSGRYVGLYKFNFKAVLLFEVIYDSIIYKMTNNGPGFIAYKNKLKTYYDPITERWIESLDKCEGISRDVETDLSVVDYRFDEIGEPEMKQGKHSWSNSKVYSMNQSITNYVIFRNGKFCGIVRKSDSLEIVQAKYSSIVPIYGNELRFECKKGDNYCILDTLGKLVIPAFKLVEELSSENIRYNIIFTTGKYGLYSRSNALLIEPNYSNYKLSFDDRILMFELNGISVYFDFKTKKFENATYRHLISRFDNRYILAEVDSKIQLIDRMNGKVKNRRKYAFNQTDYRNWAVFSKQNKHLLISLITNSEVLLQTNRIELIKSRSSMVSEYANFCYIEFSNDNLLGIMDSTGKVLIEPKYDSIHYYSGWNGHNGKFVLWRHVNKEIVVDVYFIRTNVWIRDINTAYSPGKGFSIFNLIGSNDVMANFIKIRDRYHRFDPSNMKLGKQVQIDSILFICKEGCWIIRQNGKIVMWYLDKDSLIDEGITDYKVLTYKAREVLFLRQGNVFNMAFTDFRIHQIPQIDDVFMPFDKSFQFVLKKQNKLALFSPNTSFSNFVYDEVQIGLNELIWVKMDGEWMIVKEGFW